MNEENEMHSDEDISKYLSYILRHKPDSIGLRLDDNGWASVAELLCCATNYGNSLNREILERIVNTSDKKRFIFSEDKTLIRAAHGHSIKKVSLNYEEQNPPAFLFHGTAQRFLQSILAEGLRPMERQFVHLTDNLAVAEDVGARHGKVIVLEVLAEKMILENYRFYLSDSGVWLTKIVPPSFLRTL